MGGWHSKTTHRPSENTAEYEVDYTDYPPGASTTDPFDIIYTYDIDDTRYPFTIPSDWKIKCKIYHWCKVFMRRLIGNPGMDEAFPVDYERKAPKRLPPEKRVEILLQCKDKGPGVCNRLLVEARRQQQITWMVNEITEALRVATEKRQSKAATQQLAIGISTAVFLLVMGAVLLYCFVFKKEDRKKKSKKGGAPTSKISSGKGKLSSLKRSKFSVKSGHSGHHHHKHHKKSSAGTSKSHEKKSGKKSHNSSSAAKKAASSSVKAKHSGKMSKGSKRTSKH
ncbi:hypothetical protein TYRP_008727 [Tyrophagus putrescentiae]|nr:hypothetical protein TYRP_008727 [Tyrophagus putrescentiae]